MTAAFAQSDVTVINASLEHADHQIAVVDLINGYRADQMGGALPPMTDKAKGELITLLHNHPGCRLFLAKVNRQFAGLIVSFITLSTFQAQPLLNVHDLIVKKEFRRQGVGKCLLMAAREYARSVDCCRMTLEVRSDNSEARKLYESIGFAPCNPPMEFWRMEI